MEIRKMKSKKNIQVIDGAQNCTYSIFATNQDDFDQIFSGEKQDIEFVQDFIDRVGKRKANNILKRLWLSPQDKKYVQGIHGTLFYELEYKKQFYPTKKEDEMITGFRSKDSI
jgi:hypothetical protein